MRRTNSYLMIYETDIDTMVQKLILVVPYTQSITYMFKERLEPPNIDLTIHEFLYKKFGSGIPKRRFYWSIYQ